MVSYNNSNSKSRILGAEKIEVISTENDFAGVYSILPICHIYFCIFPLRTGLRIAFPCFIPMHIMAQFGYRYAETACKERSELYGDFGTK
jgi:hypothetical protein